jgi:phycobilisome core-membrane linker protein
VAEFVGLIANSELFLQRLNKLAPLPAAAASRFLAKRTTQGLAAAVAQVLSSEAYASSFGQNTVPYLRGLNTTDGIPLATVNRSAELYGGNGGLTPNPRSAV